MNLTIIMIPELLDFLIIIIIIIIIIDKILRIIIIIIVVVFFFYWTGHSNMSAVKTDKTFWLEKMRE